MEENVIQLLLWVLTVAAGGGKVGGEITFWKGHEGKNEICFGDGFEMSFYIAGDRFLLVISLCCRACGY